MKDEEVNLEEIQVSHTLGGLGEVVVTEGRGERRGCHVVDVTLLSYTLEYISLTDVVII